MPPRSLLLLLSDTCAHECRLTLPSPVSLGIPPHCSSWSSPRALERTTSWQRNRKKGGRLADDERGQGSPERSGKNKRTGTFMSAAKTQSHRSSSFPPLLLAVSQVAPSLRVLHWTGTRQSSLPLGSVNCLHLIQPHWTDSGARTLVNERDVQESTRALCASEAIERVPVGDGLPLVLC